IARTHPESKGIKSYTTYSYGLGDHEFVVMYEVDSLAAWSHVTAKLREAKARKWIVNEEPILVGVHANDFSFLEFKDAGRSPAPIM
ncbi:MAG: chlorite dismutase family protein, partial [Thermoprotei archaeon]